MGNNKGNQSVYMWSMCVLTLGILESLAIIGMTLDGLYKELSKEGSFNNHLSQGDLEIILETLLETGNLEKNEGVYTTTEEGGAVGVRIEEFGHGLVTQSISNLSDFKQKIKELLKETESPER